jgi:hypothetical protein
MKKLIVLSVVFALVASAAFAVDLSGSSINTVDVVKSSTADDATIDADASWDRLRIDGGGATEDGVFGGYFRLDAKHWSGNPQFGGNAWWKPIDQLQLLIGNNGGDGFYGKEGITGWMFYQTVTDNGTSMGGDNVWGGSLYGFGIKTREAFFGGDGGGDALRLDIKPIDILGININLPFFNGGELADVFAKVIAQLDLNLSFGNIAVTYVGGSNTGSLNDDGDWDYDAGSVFVYYGGSFGDLSLDFGLGYHFDKEDASANKVVQPIGVGLGIKYATDSFGIKFRTVATLAGDDKATKVLVDILPFFPLSERITAFIGVGIGMNMPDGEDTVIGWHFNPYLQIGEEWGAKFLVGIKVKTIDEVKDSADNKLISWSIPIALSVGF